MKTFITYILPVLFFAITFALASIFNLEFFFFPGVVISLIWLNRVAAKYENKPVKILTTLALLGILIWGVWLLMWASSW